MQTITLFLKLFIAFLLTMLLSISAYAVDIQLDGNIIKVSALDGNTSDDTTCNTGDVYRLSNTTLYNDKEFDLLLRIVDAKNDGGDLNISSFDHRHAKCIEVTNHSDQGKGVTVDFRLRAKNDADPEDGNFSRANKAYMKIEIIPILKSTPPGEVPSFYSREVLSLDKLAFTAFDLDITEGYGGHDTGTDDVYIRYPGVAKLDDHTRVDATDINISGESFIKFKGQGRARDDDGKILSPGDNGYYDADCQDGQLITECSASGILREGTERLIFILQNDNANGYARPYLPDGRPSRTYESAKRLMSISFEGAIILGQDHGDMPESYGDAYHEINETLILGNEIADQEEHQYSADADADDIVDENNTDDEGAVSIAGASGDALVMTAGYTYTFNVETKGHGYLSAWADSNGDGHFTDEEQIIIDHEVNSSAATIKQIQAAVPVNSKTGNTFIRFRLSEHNSTKFSGDGGIGEVEDYTLRIVPSGTQSGTVYNDVDLNGNQNNNESGFVNVTVAIKAANGETQTVITDENGSYQFIGVALGDANITVDESTLPEADLEKTINTTNPTTVEISSTTAANIFHGYAKQQVDLVTRKTVDNDIPLEGDIVTYTITVTNNGPADARDVTLTDRLPDGISYVSHDSNAANSMYDPSNGTWNIGDIANGQTVSLHIRARVDINTAGIQITNIVTPASSPGMIDPTTNGDELRATVTVANLVDIEIASADAQVTEGGILVFNMHLSHESNNYIVVQLVNIDGSASEYQDYYPATRGWMAIFPPHSTTQRLEIQTIDDHLVEGTENLQLSFKVYRANRPDPAYNENLSATGTILDNDSATVHQVHDADAPEGTVLTHAVEVIASINDETYNFSIEEDTATAGEDYNATPTFDNNVTYDADGGTITVPAGVTSFNVNVPSIADDVVEGNETYIMHIENATGTGTIVEITTPIVKSVGNASVSEGAVLTHAVEVTRSVEIETYDFSIEDTTTAAEDYNATPTFDNNVTYDVDAGTITVPEGVVSFNVEVQSIEDGIYEGNETYSMHVGNETGIGTIRDDINPIVKSIGDAHALEGEPLTHTVEVTPSVDDVTYDFRIEDNTTTVGEDYHATPIFSNDEIVYDANEGTITVPEGVTTFDVTVESVGDNISESNETYILHVGDKTATGTIIDNTPVVVESITDDRQREGEDLLHHVVLSTTTSVAVNFNLTIENVTTSDNDYGVPTFTNGVTLEDNILTVPAGVQAFDIFIDTLNNPDFDSYLETYSIHVGDQSATGGIIDGA